MVLPAGTRPGFLYPGMAWEWGSVWGGAGWLLWLGRRECGEALLPGCSGFVVISKIEKTSDASPPHVIFWSDICYSSHRALTLKYNFLSLLKPVIPSVREKLLCLTTYTLTN